MNDDLTYIKKEEFAELEVLEEALAAVDKYFVVRMNELEESYRKGSISRESYNKRKKTYMASKQKASEMVNSIRHAMAEYERAVQEINALENANINSIMSEIQDKKILKVFAKENLKIKSKKLQAKRELVKALENKNLKNVMTAITVDVPKDRSINPEQSIDSYVISSSPMVHESLGKIIDHVKANKVANEFIASTEENGIRTHGASDVYRSLEASEYKGKVVSTGGSPLYTTDEEYAQLQSGEESFKSIADDQLETIDYIIKSDIKLDSKQQKKVKITKKEYEQLASVDLECQRVQKALVYLNKYHVCELYPKTAKMLTAYGKKLSEQQKKLMASSERMAKDAKIDTFERQAVASANYDLFEAKERKLMFEIEEARGYGDMEKVAKLEEELQQHRESFLEPDEPQAKR